jgi:phenylpropionate dioxygenase-like ring-hydroxylating dioxygenase large terminal subunit
MAGLDFWHPVALSGELKQKPLRVEICGEAIAVFRSEEGLGALRDRCPHRGMRLSEGAVKGAALECPYHGWRWAPDGAGESPGNPKVGGRARCFAVTERRGAVWVKNAASDAPFPSFDVSGHHLLCELRRRARAPLEVVLDNFIEVEHTGHVHALLGYETARMNEVETRVETTDDRVSVFNRGPQRPLPAPLRALVQIEPGDAFVDAWTTYFRPVYTVYDQYWLDPASGERRPNWLRIAVFFNPVDAQTTDLFVFAYSSQPPWGRLGLNLVLKPLMRQLVAIELERDVALVERLDEGAIELRGGTLGRFDKALTAARKRLQQIYRGGDAAVDDRG